DAPRLLAAHGIPRRQMRRDVLRDERLEAFELGGDAASAFTRVDVARRPVELGVGLVRVDRFERRYVDEPALRAVRHRMPVVSARDAGSDARFGLRPGCYRPLDRPPGLEIDAGCPRLVDVRIGGQQLPGRTVE